mmetsp:Transcript_11144/g.23433  ORF Transcript_11144/g.23433 Transcript_11144/m.23433 type:complete len:273 (-) Transcript_11144:1198-2016(-)
MPAYQAIHSTLQCGDVKVPCLVFPAHHPIYSAHSRPQTAEPDAPVATLLSCGGRFGGLKLLSRRQSLGCTHKLLEITHAAALEHIGDTQRLAKLTTNCLGQLDCLHGIDAMQGIVLTGTTNNAFHQSAEHAAIAIRAAAPNVSAFPGASLSIHSTSIAGVRGGLGFTVFVTTQCSHQRLILSPQVHSEANGVPCTLSSTPLEPDLVPPVACINYSVVLAPRQVVRQPRSLQFQCQVPEPTSHLCRNTTALTLCRFLSPTIHPPTEVVAEILG